MLTQEKMRALCAQFEVYGDFVLGIPYGTGHINDTYQITYDQGGLRVHYILQRINHNVFRQVEQLMDNFQRVTRHLAARIAKDGQVGRRHTIRLLNTATGKPFVRDEEGNYYRMYVFVENARTYDILETAAQAYSAAQAFGQFQSDLADIPGGRLYETIPDFHNTPKRIENLEKAIAADKMGRLKEVAREVDFVMARKQEAGKLIDLQKQGVIPERITHNDTKLNNVLIDDLTGAGVAVIDLDTVMPGLAHYDFGDMVRTGTSPAAEDEKDLNKVSMRFPMFEALLRGYVAGAGSVLNDTEKELLPFSGKLITMEIGVRFLTDYLEGDVYFKIHRPEHNLDRCRTQFKLVESIESQMDPMQKLLKTL